MENYPDQQPAKRVSDSAKQIYRQPGHTIYLLPTMVVANLLPCDFNYYIKGTSIRGSLKPGKEAVLHAADTSQNMELGQDLSIVSHWLEAEMYILNLLPVLTAHAHNVCSTGILLENFPICKELLIPPGTQNYVVRMRLYDTNKRLLCLTIRIILRAQGALKILISAPYWLINKTGNVAFGIKNYIYTDFTIKKLNLVIALRACSLLSFLKAIFLCQVCL